MSVPHDLLHEGLERPSWVKSLKPFDWIWAAIVVAGAVFGYFHYQEDLNQIQTGILIGVTVGVIGLGLNWKAVQPYTLVVAALSVFAVWLYGDSLQAAEHNFFLKYMLASQSAISWMSALFVMAMVSYFIGLFANSSFAAKTGSALTWSALVMGMTGMMVRWRESYLISPDFGHIPVSNLYEVFILFCIVTGLLYMFYEGRYKNRSLGGFVLLIISAAVGFLLWYSFDRGANQIQPLVPALKSYWMKIHVPANFIGYGSFALSAMVGIAYLLRTRAERVKPNGILATRLPTLEILDDVMYKSIALGFAFFTIATILGAMWAAEAWGGYWSWDQKETWALIVWLNYAAWLHMRFSKGWHGSPMAWWAIVGLGVTTFAFLGVNMFLSGLHSYGGL
jgi:cytochrome c-type biogenesis protein CcsB